LAIACLSVDSDIIVSFPVAPTLLNRASVKRFVSLQFLKSRIVSRTRWTGDRPIARPLHTQRQNKRTQTSMP
jgi:hypothetical protein